MKIILMSVREADGRGPGGWCTEVDGEWTRGTFADPKTAVLAAVDQHLPKVSRADGDYTESAAPATALDGSPAGRPAPPYCGRHGAWHADCEAYERAETTAAAGQRVTVRNVCSETMAQWRADLFPGWLATYLNTLPNDDPRRPYRIDVRGDSYHVPTGIPLGIAIYELLLNLESPGA